MKRSIVSSVQGARGSATIGSLAALTELGVNNNQLTELPATISTSPIP